MLCNQSGRQEPRENEQMELLRKENIISGDSRRIQWTEEVPGDLVIKERSLGVLYRHSVRHGDPVVSKKTPSQSNTACHA